MATLNFNRLLSGIGLQSSNEFDGILDAAIVSRSSTRLTLDDADGDYITFVGTGISYQMSGNRIVGISGTLNTVLLTNPSGSETYLTWSGLNTSAASFLTYVKNFNWTALNSLLFNTSDTYNLTNGRDVVRGFGGNDVMNGFNGNDRLFGDQGNDKLFGGIGTDSLNGGSGADRLVGGAGIDTLTGGAGADVFVFEEKGAANRDIITDFSAVDDALHFDNGPFNAFNYTGQLRAANFTTGTAATDTSDRFIYQKSTGNLWYDADGSRGGAKVLVAELADGTTLTAADIFII